MSQDSLPEKTGKGALPLFHGGETLLRRCVHSNVVSPCVGCCHPEILITSFDSHQLLTSGCIEYSKHHKNCEFWRFYFEVR